jgi:integrase
MPSVFKRTTKKPLPAGARVVERKSGPVAEWTDSRGDRRSEPLTPDRLSIRVEAATYTVQYMDEHGHPQRVASRCRDYAAAEQLGRELEKRAMQRREGLLDPVQERFAKAARVPIAEHAAAHVGHLRAAGNTAKHVRTVERHLRVILAAAGIERLSDLKSAAVLSAISAMRNPPPVDGEKKPKQPASLSTCNSHLRSMKGFSRWLWKQRLTPEDALLDLSLYNAATDRRHIRREMAAEEVHWLLDVTEQRTLPEHGAPGPTRAMCYRLAAATGFRASELRSLTTDSFDLDANPPTCTVEAGYSKRRKRDVQPLPEALVEPLRAWLAGFDPGEPVFGGIARDTARMLRSDLAAARSAWLKAAEQQPESVKEEMAASDFLLYSDRQGHVADFHSLRVLFISRVVASGASVKEAQTLARHSTPVLTMNTYSRATLLDVAGAVEGLGDLLTKQPTRPEKEAAAMRATGTHGRTDRSPVDVHTDVHKGSAQEGSTWHSAASVRLADHTAEVKPEKAKTPETPGESKASRGSSTQRLRSESNRRWRICNQKPSPGNPEENRASASDVHADVHTEPADPALAAVVEAWSSLPAAVRAGILAMVEASKR